MRGIIRYFIQYPVAGNTLMFLIFIFGFFGYKTLRSTFFPVNESKIITIRVTYPGASPEEVEEGIIIKIEDNLKGTTGVERVSSVSQENAGSVKVEVEKDYSTDLILQDVKNAVDQISSFPTGMEPPVIYKQETQNFVISFALSGKVDLKTLKTFARQAENDLRTVDGISKVELTGFPDEEIEIAFREDDLLAYDLTFQQATDAVRQANLELTGGTIKEETQEVLVRARSKEYFATDLRDIVLKTSANGGLIRLSDVADVSDRWADDPNRTYINGEPSVILAVSNTIEEDLLFIADTVQGYFEAFNAAGHPVSATKVRDRSITLSQRLDLLTKNGVIGFFLVLLFLTLFLNVRLSFWVAISIPISFLGMFILAAFFDMTINVMSLFGMILVIGILVDDGIVIGENIYREFEEGKSPMRAAVDGTMQVFPAVTAAVLTTVVAFSTFFFIDGRLGDFAPDLAFVVICTLIFSLVEGAFILPGHIAHSRALKGGTIKRSKVEKTLDGIMSWLRDKAYAPILRFSLQNKFFSVVLPVSAFLITMGAFSGGYIRTTFFPQIERDNVEITVQMPAGTRDHITEAKLDYISEKVWEFNEEMKKKRPDGLSIVRNVQKKIGPGINNGTVDVALLDTETRNMAVRQVARMLREKVGFVEGTDQVLFGSASPFGKSVSVSLKSNNLQELEAAAAELRLAMESLEGLADVSDNNQEGIREINITLKDKAYLLGLNLQQVLGQVRSGFFGSEAQRLQRGIDEVRVWVRYNEDDRSSQHKLETMRIRTATGQEIPLGEIAEFEIKRGVLAINHLDGKREIRLEAEPSSKKVSAVEMTAVVRDKLLPPIFAKYPSTSASFEGQQKQSSKTIKSIGLVGPIILVLMLGIVVFTFRSFWQTLLVFLIIPFGFIGVAWGHFIHDSVISLLSFFGIIGLIGIMVNDSLVLVTAFNGRLKEGETVDQAVYRAGLSRFRPIILTSVTTIAGLAPLILETSFQAQFLVPMAIAIAYGLVIATYTTLILLPVGLVVTNRARLYLTWLWEGVRPTPEAVEPAVKEMKHSDDEE